MRSRSLLALAAVLGASGCATRADLDQVRKSQREVRQIVANYTVALEDVRRKIDALQSSGTVGKGGASADPDARRRLERLEARVAALEAQAGAPPAAPGVAGNAEPAPAGEPAIGSAPWPAPAANPSDAQPAAVAAAAQGDDGFQRWVAAEEASASDSEYKSALASVRGGQCREAIPALRNVMRKNAKGVKGDHAQYTIGACFHRDRDYNRAIVELYEVLQKFPNGDRVPPSLLLLADSFAATGEKVDARLILQKVINEHPNSPEAQKAKQRLQALSE